MYMVWRKTISTNNQTLKIAAEVKKELFPQADVCRILGFLLHVKRKMPRQACWLLCIATWQQLIKNQPPTN
jgi:hypothetical protein